MRAVVTRVSSASVSIGGTVEGAIEQGCLVLRGVGPGDTEAVCDKLAEKICNLRVFEDENGRMSLSLEQVGGALLVVSQFTLYADIKSRRPGFTKAAPPAVAIPLYETFLDLCRARGFQVEHGAGGADMAVQAVDMLRDKIENGTQGYVHQILLPTLIQRGTCRKLEPSK